VSIVSADGMTVLSVNCSAPVYQIAEQVFYEEIGPRLCHMIKQLQAGLPGTRAYA